MHIILSKKLSELGHEGEDFEKEMYRSERRQWRNRQEEKLFTELDAILGHRPASVPSVLLDTAWDHQSEQLNPSYDSAAEDKANGKSLLSVLCKLIKG